MVVNKMEIYFIVWYFFEYIDPRGVLILQNLKGNQN